MGNNAENGRATSNIILDRYPIAIDASSNVISVRVITDHDSATPKTAWRHLQRVAASRVNGAIPTSNQRVHFYTDGASFESSSLAISYDPVGAISGIWQLKKGFWVENDLPEECTGQVSTSPSVRFQFVNEQDRDEFINNFKKLSQDVANSKPPATKNVTAMLRAIGRSNTPARLLPTVTTPTVLGSES